MNLTVKEKETIAYYDENSIKWAQKHGVGEEESTFKRQMLKMFRLVPKGNILEIGTGHGKEASMLIKQYGVNNYVGVDASESLIVLASERNPKAKFVHTSIYDLSMIENESIDCFWISAMLIHIPKARLGEALKSVKAKLKPNAYGFISILDGNADMDNSRPGRYYSLWSKEEFSHSLEDSGFKIVEHERYLNQAPNGNDWLAFVVENI